MSGSEMKETHESWSGFNTEVNVAPACLAGMSSTRFAASESLWLRRNWEQLLTKFHENLRFRKIDVMPGGDVVDTLCCVWKSMVQTGLRTAVNKVSRNRKTYGSEESISHDFGLLNATLRKSKLENHDSTDPSSPSKRTRFSRGLWNSDWEHMALVKLTLP